MSEGPKLYANKPKKAQLKPREQGSQSQPQFSSSMASQEASSKAPSPPPPPAPPRESFARRYKFIWPLLLAVNISIGAYLFMRTKKKDTSIEEGKLAEISPSSVPTSSTTPVPVTEKTLSPSTIIEPAKLREPIPESQQRELFKWMLEEKRKVKPKDSEEKKRIDEEKAILKQFIRAKSIPNL